ncbi:MAG: DUF4405 domain-containing protein [Anaerolineaceae bacterium]
MNRKMLVRLVIDLVMTILILLAFAYQLTGNTAHELIGMVIIALFLTHNLLNRQWYQTLQKGKRSSKRIMGKVVNLLLLADMALLAVSSVMISRDLFAFLQIRGGFLARQIHTLTSYWGLILLSIHLGMHWGMVQKVTGIASANRARTTAFRILALSIAAFGIKASFDLGIGSKLTLYDTFGYWDFEASTAAFFISYLSVMGLYVCATYYMLKWMGQVEAGRKSSVTTGDVHKQQSENIR